MFYYVMVARLAFVIIFENFLDFIIEIMLIINFLSHFVYSILFLVRYLIAHVPHNLRVQLDRCRYLVQQMYWYEFHFFVLISKSIDFVY
jgi:hypothetical protein